MEFKDTLLDDKSISDLALTLWVIDRAYKIYFVVIFMLDEKLSHLNR